VEVAERNIDRFQVKRILGEGGQGIVFLAHDPKLGRDVAIKTLTASSAEEIARLLQEARSVSALRHPCIVPVFEAGDLHGTPYLVFEYVVGETLDALIRRAGALPTERALQLAGQLLDGLAHAHRHGVLHRDIKPANIMLGGDGTPRIMDFGAASRNTMNWLDSSHVAIDQQLIGTPAYMAPEYIENKLYSASTDIFAAGLTIAEMLTGQRILTVQGHSVEQLLERIVSQPIELPAGHGLHPRIAACLQKALARDPAQRFDSVIEMKQALLGAAQPDALAPARAEDRGALEFLLRRMRLKKEFPAMSESISNVNGIIFSDKGSVTALTNAVLKDFALTNKIIKLANSSYYNPSGQRNIATVSAAIHRLGFDTLRNIVLGLLLFDQMKDRDQARELMGECAQAILCGAIAREICIDRNYPQPEETFICAMLHNLGRILALYYFPEESAEIRKNLALGESDEDSASRQVLGCSYTELGQGVADAWGFPPAIIASMARHLPSGAARGAASPAETQRLVACLASDLAAALLGAEGDGQKRRTAATLQRYSGRLKLDSRSLDTVFAHALDKFNEYRTAAGWKLEPAMLKRLGAMEQALAGGEAPDREPPILDLAAIQAGRPAGSAAPATPSAAPARVKRGVLSGGIEDVTHAMVEGSGLNEVLRIVLESIYIGIGFDHAIFALRDARRGLMLGRFGLGEGIDALVAGLRFPLSFAPDVFHVALQKNIDIFIADSQEPRIAARIPLWHREAFSARAFLLLPIVMNGQPLGLIYADAARPGAVTIGDEEIRLLRTLRNQAVLAVRLPG
jgi:serine/threonine protein kinase